MNTIELSAALGQAQVVENLKNFVGVDAQGAAALMTPERLAAVAGGLLTGRKIITDADKCLETGFYVTGYNVVGLPTGIGGCPMIVFKTNENSCAQVLILGDKFYYRLYWKNSFQNWYVIKANIINS